MACVQTNTIINITMGEANFDLKFDAKLTTASSEQQKFREMVEYEVEGVTTGSEDAETRTRRKIVCELLQTEVSYLLQLELLIQFFMASLKTLPQYEELFGTVFSNIIQLYQVNCKLLEEMENNIGSIWNAFTVFAPFLKLYSIYACEYKKAINSLESLKKRNKPIFTIIKRQETRPEVGTSFISLLISPIQRVPRYRLLLQSLVANTRPETEDHERLLGALIKVEESADHINKLVTNAEECEALLKFARRLGTAGNKLVIPGRKILKQGVIMKTSKNGSSRQQRYLVLMNDSLLCCKGGESGPLGFSRLLPLRNLKIEPAIGSALFKVTCNEDSLLLFTSDAQDGLDWLKAIDSAVKQYATCRRTLRKDSSKLIRKKRGRIGSACISTASKISRSARRACKSDLKQVCISNLRRLRNRGNSQASS